VAAHYFSNLQIADLLRNVASALQLESEDKNRFRIIAYNRAADAIEHASSDIKDLWDNHELDSVAGIGEAIASYLDELFTRGKVAHFQQIIQKNPPAFYELLTIPNIGPVTAHKLCQELGLSKKAGCLKKLQKAALKGRIPAHLIQTVLDFSPASRRLLLHQATQIAEALVRYLQTCPQVITCEPLGSLRRQVSTVGDIDLAVSTLVPATVISYFCNYPKKSEVLDAGNTKASLMLHDGIRVDLMTCDPKTYGSLLQHLTGSKHHNIALREYALKKGFSMSEYGLKKLIPAKKTSPSIKVREGRGVSYETEKELYKALGLDYIPPELREDSGEITAAKAGQLPRLVQLSDIQGDLHLHSSFDTEPAHDLGQHPLARLVEKAKLLNYAYLGLTEHNSSVSNHKIDNIYSILSNKKELVAKYNNSNREIYCFNGLEIDIQTDGILALPDSCFELLDYAIVSIHSGFRQNKLEMTKRVMAGLSHPKALILGHPTGRLLQQREGISLDWDQLFDFCLKHHKILEIDAWPNRLDLPDTLVREAVKAGVKMIISSDSHSLDHMEYIRYGLSVARRGWATASDIINTYSLTQLKGVIFK